jgi:predicted DNA-binding antitoxin AbrB/MazE fold protein
MVIHAIYENGVFRPIDAVELPDRCEVDLMVQQSRPQESQSLVASPLAKIAAIASQHPDNVDLPVDLAEQHDHYLYRTAKRS